ncbi:hypothetical protein DFA_10637 [Cavenderia fasciculata]|uniref:Paramecium surface antigen repeat-containing protein n=1 Tax=Cavenderia fasciculata TaxID=261658 RepID=F4QAZ2_CACFS|nr:uncharacterized protein DFA_10637 [Cavenderia fasciculata]EGG14764.1 hypothetical protein DFA_10637 [Cavenderia fasciculata]|eukprot:XP_004351280.1 hypothetical protein DFA_10637 [Cavenderia fasciculata]
MYFKKVLIILVISSIINLTNGETCQGPYAWQQRDCVSLGSACNNTNSTCINSYCKEDIVGSNVGVCTEYIAAGGACTDSQSCTPWLSCTFSVCVATNYLQNGDDCTEDYECYSPMKCTNSKCTQPASCIPVENSCPPGQFCTAKNGTCIPIQTLGESCSARDECGINLVCSPVNTTSSICMEPFSQGVAGSKCSNTGSYFTVCDISQGLYCNQSNVCAQIPDTPSNSVCTNDDDCNAVEKCLCSGGDQAQGKCVSNLATTNETRSECITVSLDYANCLIENKCSVVYFNVVNTLSSKSCFAKCTSEMCAKSVCAGPAQNYPELQCEETAGNENIMTCSNSSIIETGLIFIFFAILSTLLF